MKVLIIILFSISIFADSVNLDSLSDQEAVEISKEFATNFLHTSVAGAQSLGDKFGLEVGLVGGLSTTPELERLVREQDASLDVSKIPHAGLLSRLSIPFGFTLEALAIPSVSAADAELSIYSGAIMWTVTDLADLKLPIHFAFKGFYSKSEFSYSQIINNTSTGNTDVNADVGFETTSYGAIALLSADFVVIRPYIGAGTIISSETDIGINESSQVASFFVSGVQSFNTDQSSGYFVVGSEITLGLIHIGAEMSRAHGVTRGSAKFSLAF